MTAEPPKPPPRKLLIGSLPRGVETSFSRQWRPRGEPQYITGASAGASSNSSGAVAAAATQPKRVLKEVDVEVEVVVEAAGRPRHLQAPLPPPSPRSASDWCPPPAPPRRMSNDDMGISGGTNGGGSRVPSRVPFFYPALLVGGAPSGPRLGGPPAADTADDLAPRGTARCLIICERHLGCVARRENPRGHLRGARRGCLQWCCGSSSPPARQPSAPQWAPPTACLADDDVRARAPRRRLLWRSCAGLPECRIQWPLHRRSPLGSPAPSRWWGGRSADCWGGHGRRCCRRYWGRVRASAAASGVSSVAASGAAAVTRPPNRWLPLSVRLLGAAHVVLHAAPTALLAGLTQLRLLLVAIATAVMGATSLGTAVQVPLQTISRTAEELLPPGPRGGVIVTWVNGAAALSTTADVDCSTDHRHPHLRCLAVRLSPGSGCPTADRSGDVCIRAGRFATPRILRRDGGMLPTVWLGSWSGRARRRSELQGCGSGRSVQTGAQQRSHSRRCSHRRQQQHAPASRQHDRCAPSSTSQMRTRAPRYPNRSHGPRTFIRAGRSRTLRRFKVLDQWKRARDGRDTQQRD